MDAKDSKKEDQPKPAEQNGSSDDKKEIKTHIPIAEFVEDVDKFMQDPNNPSATAVLRRFEEQHAKYKFLDTNILEKKKRLRRTLPDLQKSLNMIEFLKTKKDNTTVQYLLASGVYAHAEVAPTEKVYLWLGANVMLEYPIDEAAQILDKNSKAAKKSLQQLDDDLGFISDQCTTLEVAISRVYNWDVKERREKKKPTQ